MSDLYVITGSSRGLGAALAEQLLTAGHRVLGLARGVNGALAGAAAAGGAALEQWAVDLAEAPAVAARLEQWLAQARDPAVAGAPASATLINNAGVLAAVGPVDRLPTADLSTVLRVDIEAPILLTAAFLRATAGWRAQRRVLNISSGAAGTAYAGWASYCAAKAALDQFSRAAALDEALRAAAGGIAAQIVSLAPGVIDTAMQAQLRAADPSGFPAHRRFVDLHQRGELTSPAAAAVRVLAYLERPDFGAQPVADVRQP